MIYYLTTSQLLALLEHATRMHLLALNALGVPWTKELRAKTRAALEGEEGEKG